MTLLNEQLLQETVEPVGDTGTPAETGGGEQKEGMELFFF